VQRHGGSIGIESEMGKGTTVVIRLPALTPEIGAVPPGSAGPCRPLRVLLVEDEPEVCDIEAEYLRGDGHFVETATDGREGLKRFGDGHFDVVVADRAMPEMNGDQMTEAIKQISPDTPVVLVTGFADMLIDGVDGKHLPDLVMRKPITQTALRQAIARVLSAVPKPDQPNQAAVSSP